MEQFHIMLPDGGKDFIKAVAALRMQNMTDFVMSAVLHECGLSEWPAKNEWGKMTAQQVRIAIMNAQFQEAEQQRGESYIVNPADIEYLVNALRSVSSKDPFNMPISLKTSGKLRQAIRRILSIPAR